MGAERARRLRRSTARVADPPIASRVPRAPTLLDALLPIVVLIVLLALTIVLFGVNATDGPLQVALLLSAAFASLIAFKNGYTVAAVADAAVGGVTSAVGAIFILLAVGALIGTWNMAGTIPTVVDYGIRLVSPTWFYLDHRGRSAPWSAWSPAAPGRPPARSASRSSG